ncbi:hypothetical protein LSH36_83g06055 [Paralvinella palmiformis]|uniref:G-protein coupled receptors family 1 profile domain-containing protein n=1 Tax=Paralvinella palmiformis TaxID=53620 RepID=A0AAD9K1Z0_9ANNE|nr:hypothetical protein LSH36_83g06055 [Paralvinella palmiformis]
MESGNNSSAVARDEGSQLIYIIYISGEVVIAALTVFGNGLVIVAIAKHSQLQTITNYFVANLAAADFLVGVLGIPCALISFVELDQSFISCAMVNLMILILTQISVLGLCAVAVERFVAIKYPYRYVDGCTSNLCAAIIVAVWLLGILAGVIPLMAWKTETTYGGKCSFTAVIDMRHVVYVNFFVCTLAPLAFMFAIYCYMFRVVKLQIRRIAALQQIVANASRNLTFRKDAKAAMWFAVVIILFAISWLPIHIMNCVTLYGGSTCVPCLLVAIILSHANSAINPILYAYANSKFKTAFKQMMRLKDSDY